MKNSKNRGGAPPLGGPGQQAQALADLDHNFHLRPVALLRVVEEERVEWAVMNQRASATCRTPAHGLQNPGSAEPAHSPRIRVPGMARRDGTRRLLGAHVLEQNENKLTLWRGATHRARSQHDKDITKLRYNAE
jgi:hypothetical protein